MFYKERNNISDNTSIKNQRSVGIDLVKAISVFGVIVIHIAGPLFYTYPVGSTDWNVTLFLGVIVRASVPLFLMCSGALILDPEKELSLKKLYLRTIPRILAAMLFWGMMYKLYHLVLADAVSMDRIFHAFKELLLFNHEYHFYYMHIILLVYVFFINELVRIGINAEASLPILFIPALSLLVFVVSFVTYFVISKIPVLNKWII